MEPSNRFKSQGSFGIPEKMKRDMEADRQAHLASQQVQPQPQPQRPPEAPPIPLAPAEEPAPTKAPPTSSEPSEEEQAKNLADFRAKIEDSLGASIEEKDIQDYIFRGRLTKEVHIIKGVLRGVFQTLTPDELQEIDERVAEFQNKGKHTADGLINEKAIVTLSYAWVAAAGKPLAGANDPAKREEKIRKMGAITVDNATRAFNELNLLLRVLFGEKSFLKKS